MGRGNFFYGSWLMTDYTVRGIALRSYQNWRLLMILHENWILAISSNFINSVEAGTRGCVPKGRHVAGTKNIFLSITHHHHHQDSILLGGICPYSFHWTLSLGIIMLQIQQLRLMGCDVLCCEPHKRPLNRMSILILFWPYAAILSIDNQYLFSVR